MTTTDIRPWHGVLVATALPAARRPLRRLRRATPSTAPGWSTTAATASCPNGSLGEYQTLTAEERARVVETAVAAVGGATA